MALFTATEDAIRFHAMSKVRRLLSILALVALGATGLVFSPALVIIAPGCIVGKSHQSTDSLCKVIGPAAWTRQSGAEVDSGCCAEHMMGECFDCQAKLHPGNIRRRKRRPGGDAAAPRPRRGSRQELEMGDALTVASRQGHGDMVEGLLNRGATPRSLIRALPVAAHGGRLRNRAKQILGRVEPAYLAEACRTLFCALASELEQRGSPLLPRQRDLFVEAVRTCPDPNLVCKPWRLLTQIAKDEANAPLVKALLDKGADLDALEENGGTVRAFLSSYNDFDSRPK